MSQRGHLFACHGQTYLVLWNLERFEIWGCQLLDCLQSFRNLFADIVTITTTERGELIVLTSREVVFYGPIINAKKQLLWRKVTSQSFDQTCSHIYYCPKQDLVLLLAPHSIIGLSLKTKTQESFTISAEMSISWEVKVKQKLESMSVSPDNRHLSLISEDRKLLVWSIERIPQLINHTMNLEQFVKVNQVWQLENKVKSMQFLKTDETNNLLIVSDDCMQIYQEVKIGDGQHSFVQVLQLPQERLRQVVMVNRLGQSEQNSDRKRQSLDIFIIHSDVFQVAQIYGLRQGKGTISHKMTKKLQLKQCQQIIEAILQPGEKHISLLSVGKRTIQRILYMFHEDHILQSRLFGLKLPLQQLFVQEYTNWIVTKDKQGQCWVIEKPKSWFKSQQQTPSPFTVNEQQFHKIDLEIKEKMSIAENKLFWVRQKKFIMAHLPQCKEIKQLPFHKESLRQLNIIDSNNKAINFLCDGDLVRLDLQREPTLTVVKTLVPFNRVLKLEYIKHNRSLLVKNPKFYMLYQLKQETYELVEIRKSMRHMIYGGGFWAELYENQVVFGRGQTKVVTLNLALFFSTVAKQNDLKILFYRIWHLRDSVFQLQVQNYIFFLNVEFDLKKQKHVVTAVRKNKHSMELMTVRVSRKVKPQAFELDLQNGQIIVKTDDVIVQMGRYLSEPVIKIDGLTDTVFLNLALLKSAVPMHHPKFLNELFLMAYFSQVDTLLWLFYSKIIRQETLPHDFTVDIGDLMLLLTNRIAQRQFIAKYVEPVDFQKGDRLSYLTELERIIVEEPHRCQLHKNYNLVLSSLVQFCRYRQENSRSLDFFSTVFVSQTRHLWAAKNQCVSTRDVCWILSSSNKQEAFQVLIEQPLKQKEENLTWSLLCRYAVIIWYDNFGQVKKWLERIALSEYKQKQDPFDCLLWYVLLGKKPILLALFKKAVDQVKTYEFLQRDFNVAANKTAASKNAYALLSKKRYEHSLAFFILAGSFKDAISVCINQLQDIQLAILICRLFESQMGKQPLIQIFRQNFLQTGQITGDIWISHIGYFLLNQYVQSYNCLFRSSYDEQKIINDASRMSCDTWRPEFEPHLSVFHPSVMILAEKLQESFRVKRQLQQYEEMKKQSNKSNDIFQQFGGLSEQNEAVQEIQQKSLKPNFEYHLTQSANYYLMANMPFLSLILLLQKPENKQLLEQSAEQYVQQLFVSVLQYGGMSTCLPRIVNLPKLLNNSTNYLKMFERKLKQVDCGELLLEFYNLTDTDKVEPYLAEYVRNLSAILLEEATPFKIQSRQWYMKILHSIYWLQVSLSKIDKTKPTYCQMVICLELSILLIKIKTGHGGIAPVVRTLLLACQKLNRAQHFNEEISMLTIEQMNQMSIPDRKYRWETSKTPKRMDIFEQAFRRAVVDEKHQYEPIDSVLPWFLAYVVFGSLTQATTLESWVRQALHRHHSHYSKIVQIQISQEKLETLISQLLSIVRQNMHWAQTDNLNNEHIDKDDVMKTLELINAQKYLSSLHNNNINHQLSGLSAAGKEAKEIKQKIFKNGIELFKNKTEAVRSFTLNQYDSPQHGEFVLLFKKNMKKVDIQSSIVSRNRSQDGSILVDDDTLYTVPVDINQPRPETRCTQLQHCLTMLGGWADRKQEIIPTYKRNDQGASYLRSHSVGEQRAYTDFNELNSLLSHRFLPIFIIGGRACLEIYSFSSMRSLGRLQFSTLQDIVKLKMDASSNYIGCMDSQGNLSCSRFQPTYSAASILQIKKQSVGQFTFLESNLVCITNSKDNNIQIIDPLIHPAKQCVYKDRINNVIGLQYMPQNKKIIAVKKTEVAIFDIRRGFQNRFDTVGETRTSAVLSDCLLTGTQQGQIRLYDLDGTDRAIVKPFRQNKKQPAIQEIRTARKDIFALSSDGTISYAYSLT